jgi:hypothetical protein
MFERYTEKARRTIFFARYEASQFGSSQIETEHLLLGVFREDNELASHFLKSPVKLEAIRRSVMECSKTRPYISTGVDLPLSGESKRVLDYAAEESARMNDKHIDTSHLLLGLLREEKSFAARLLGEQGLTLDSLRARVQESEGPVVESETASLAGLYQWLAERESRGGIWTVKDERVGNRTTHFAIYAGDPPREDENTQDMAPAEKLAQIHKRLTFIVQRMENAIANHEFEKARFYSEEERKEREGLRLLREQFNLEETSPPVPLLCIDIIRGDRFTEVQRRCDDYIAEGVAEVWLLDATSKRAYTVTKPEGLREFKGDIIQIANPPLEMDLKKIFSWVDGTP